MSRARRRILIGALFACALALAFVAKTPRDAPAAPATSGLAQASHPGSSINKYTIWASGHGYGSSTQMLGDVTGDGKDDAVVTFAWSDGNWYVAEANAAGTGFNEYKLWATGHGYNSGRQFLADVTGDGKDDAVVFFWSGEWYVAEANAAGTAFNEYKLWSGGQGAFSYFQFVEDVTGDAKADAVVVEWTGDWYVAPANTAGTGFDGYRRWGSAGPRFFNHLLADVTGDGKADAVAPWYGDWYVAEANSTGTGFNQYRLWLTGHGQQGYPAGEFLADVNGDGKADAVAVNLWPITRWHVAEANTAGTAFNDPHLWVTGPGPWATPLAGDVTGDGLIEPVAYSWSGNWYVIDPNAFGPGFSEYTHWATEHGAGSVNQLLADVTGDSKADAVSVSWNGEWHVAPANAAGTGFDAPTLWASGHGHGSANQFLHDVTGDGKADAVVFFSIGHWYVAEANASGTGFHDYTLWATGHGHGSSNQFLADVTGDGRADAVVYFPTVGAWYVAEANASGTGFDDYTPWTTGHGYGSERQLLGDVTGDGKADAAVFFPYTYEGSSQWYVAKANASGNGFEDYTLWSTNPFFLFFFYPQTVLLGDATGDGKADATGVTWSGEWNVAEANSSGTAFNEHVLWTWGHGAGSSKQMLGDVTGDGRADAVVVFAWDSGDWYVAASHP